MKATTLTEIKCENQRTIPVGAIVEIIDVVIDGVYEIEYMGQTYVIEECCVKIGGADGY